MENQDLSVSQIAEFPVALADRIFDDNAVLNEFFYMAKVLHYLMFQPVYNDNSVIYKEQIAKKETITVEHSEMTRLPWYFFHN